MMMLDHSCFGKFHKAIFNIAVFVEEWYILHWVGAFHLFCFAYQTFAYSMKRTYFISSRTSVQFTIFGGISISQAIKRSVKKIWTQSHCNKDAVAEILVGVEYWMRSKTFTDIYRREVASNLELILLGKVDHMTLNWVSTSQFWCMWHNSDMISFCFCKVSI